jgi:hypothetical protein
VINNPHMPQAYEPTPEEKAHYEAERERMQERDEALSQARIAILRAMIPLLDDQSFNLGAVVQLSQAFKNLSSF